MTSAWDPAWSADHALPNAWEAADLGAPEVDYSAIGPVCGYDPRLMRDLRASLAVIARRTDDQELRRLAVAVLRGTTSVRRVFEHPSFQRLASASTDNLLEGLNEIDEEQREQLMARIGVDDTPQAIEFTLMESPPPPPRRPTR